VENGYSEKTLNRAPIKKSKKRFISAGFEYPGEGKNTFLH